MPAKLKCDRIDCFQNKCGARCELLSAYPSQPCPFYKTDKQADADRVKAHQRLIDIDRPDLIQKYEYNKDRRW